MLSTFKSKTEYSCSLDQVTLKQLYRSEQLYLMMRIFSIEEIAVCSFSSQSILHQLQQSFCSYSSIVSEHLNNNAFSVYSLYSLVISSCICGSWAVSQWSLNFTKEVLICSHQILHCYHQCWVIFSFNWDFWRH